MNFFTKMKFLQYSYNFEKDYIKKIMRNSLGILTILIGLLTIVLQFTGDISNILYYGGGIVIFLGIFIILTGDIDTHNPRSLFLKEINPEELNDVCTNGTYGEYDREQYRNNVFVYSDSVNSLLSRYSNKVSFIPEKFELDEPLRKIAPFSLKQFQEVKNKKLFNSQIRLCTDLTPGRLIHNEKIFLQESDYFSGLCSNELTLKEIWSKNFNEMVFNGLDLVMDRGLIVALEESRCANLIGINTILITQDGKLVIEKQHLSYAENYNQLIPSVSCSLEYFNPDKVKPDLFNLQNILLDGINDNLIKKYGFRNDEISSFLVGHARLLNRGGKPEFFAVSKTWKNFNQIKHNKNMAREIIDLTLFNPTIAEFRGISEYILGNYDNSIHLYLNLLFLSEQLRDNEKLNNFLSV